MAEDKKKDTRGVNPVPESGLIPFPHPKLDEHLEKIDKVLAEHEADK